MSQGEFQALRGNLKILRDLLPQLHAQVLGAPTEAYAPDWLQKLTQNVLPAIDFDLPVLLVAICGGGSTGKSTLFNTLAGEALSRVGFRAGLTKRVLLAGHPSVLSGPGVAKSLLRRLQRQPVLWQEDVDTTVPGAPLYAALDGIPPTLLLIDTPDFDTGEGGELRNRERAEAVLRTADVIIYVFTNAVYSNLSNTQFMSQVVGGIGGRPTVLVYRISRAASDAEVMEHCRTVGNRLYGRAQDAPGMPSQVVGFYRVHESDRVAEGLSGPSLIPLGGAPRELAHLLSGLDVASVKRHVFAADLKSIHRGAMADLAGLRRERQYSMLYRGGLRKLMTQHALEALRAFPVAEAVHVATRLFVETSPPFVRTLRKSGRVISAPLRGAVAVGRRVGQLMRLSEPDGPKGGVEQTLEQDLLLAANGLRNQLLDDHLIVRVGTGDAFLAISRMAAQDTTEGHGPTIESVGRGAHNVHIPVPEAVRKLEDEMLGQDWEATSQVLQRAARDLAGLPAGIGAELRRSVESFRSQMNWRQRLRETFFASLTALPPLLGVTYALLTADPVSGAGIWIRLQGVFGLNDLWALVSIPAAVGLDGQDRRQLEQMISPVFKLWLERRVSSVVDVFAETVCRPPLEALGPASDREDARFDAVAEALASLEASL